MSARTDTAAVITVPVSAAATLLLDRPDLAALASSHVRLLGQRPEVHTGALAAAGPAGAALAAALERYWACCEQLWADLRDGRPSGPYVMVTRTVHHATQQNSKKAKVDLTGELAACADVAQVADIVTALTDPDPDRAALARLAESVDGAFTDDETGLSVSVPATGALTWPELLGGVTWPGEVRRTLTVTAKHAAWRDRRVRRLWRVVVDVDEVWPDPSVVDLPPG